jgi:hypothetical protein
MTPKPRKAEIAAPLSVPGMELKALEYKAVEDPQEKAIRLRKEMLNFYVKELLIWVIGCVFIVLTGFYCLWVLVRSESPPADKDRAWSAFMAILG